MNIGVYLPPLSKSPVSNFIVETFFPLFNEIHEHQFIVIKDVSSEVQVIHFQTVSIRPQPGNPLLRRFWIEKTLAGTLKKIAADIFISADNFCSLSTALPQIIMFPDPEKLKPSYAKKARLILATDELAKKELLHKLKIPEEKIAVIYPGAGRQYLSIDTEKRESTKTKYSEGKEYFLSNSSFRNQEDLVNLLKSFSQFKKRQQSSFKLLITGHQNFPPEKTIDNYKYKSDVVIVSSINEDEKAAILAAAYAVVLPFYPHDGIAAALNAMQSGVPVIAIKDSFLKEMGKDVVLFADREIKDVGHKMMQLYKDENLRSELIKKGKELVKDFTLERSADALKQSILKVVN